jgi:PAS domain S-box-containing protein
LSEGVAGGAVRILLVDDRVDNLLSLKGILDRPDYELVLASSGPEALRLVLHDDFAVILLDVAMPEMDGFEVATLLKKRERYRNVPIIFVTASVQQIEWIFRAYSIGAVDFLSKPLDPHAVRAKVAVFVELYRQRKLLDRQAALLEDGERRGRGTAVAPLLSEDARSHPDLAERVPHIVWTADAAGRIEYFNQRWYVLTGRSLEDSLGEAWLGALDEEDVPLTRAHWAEAVAHRQPVRLETRLRLANGQPAWFLFSAVPEGDDQTWVGTLTDVDDLRRAQNDARSAIALRDEFLSIASHELRTPLTALQLKLKTLARAVPNACSQEARPMLESRIDSAIRQSERLERLIERLLDVSRIASGGMRLEVEELDLSALVSELVDRYRDEAEQAGSVVDLETHGPLIGRWDRVRMEQVVINLLTNAIKYGAGRPIDVHLKGTSGGARLVVRDRGIGLDPAKASRVFERFERLAPIESYSGLGLGLYIVRKAVEAHGGRIAVDSAPGQGATFVVEVPLAPPARTRPERTIEAPTIH